MASAQTLYELTASWTPRDRAALGLLAGAEAIKGLTVPSECDEARSSLALARDVLDGRAAPDRIEDALQNENDEGILIREQETDQVVEKAAWLSIASALAYAARVAYQAAGRLPGPLISEVRDTELAELERHLSQIPGVDWSRLLSSRPDI